MHFLFCHTNQKNVLQKEIKDQTFDDDDDDDDDDDCFYGTVDWQKVFSLISGRDHCQRYSPSRISDMLQAQLEPVQNLNVGFAEWS